MVAAESVLYVPSHLLLVLYNHLPAHLLSGVFPEPQAPLGSPTLHAHLPLAVLNRRMAVAPPTILAEGNFSLLHPSPGPVLVMA